MTASTKPRFYLLVKTSDTINTRISRLKVIRRLFFVAIAFATAINSSARAELYINEIFGDPGGNGSDIRDEYIELRGTPGMSLANHYLIFVENERNAIGLGSAGSIENIFIFGDVPDTQAVEPPYSIGSNEFLLIRQRNNLYNVFGNPAPGTTNLVNSGSGEGWGSGSTSSIRHYGENDKVVTENSGFTAMLVRNNGPDTFAPVLGQDLDQGNDGLDPADGDLNDWRDHWTILDSIGYQGEEDEGDGWLYGFVNFGQEDPLNAHHEGEYAQLDYEIEYVGRWGNSTGYTSVDWHVANLTENAGSGSLGIPDFRQSCVDIDGVNCHPASDSDNNTPPPQPERTESNMGVPYGIQLTRSLGAPNFLLGDYNQDGAVDAADYTVWRDALGQPANELSHQRADHSHDFVVNQADYEVWKAHVGEPGLGDSGSGAGTFSGSIRLPEPPSIVLTLSCVIAFASIGRKSYIAG